ncbi:MAG: SLC13 family permease, partial [Planctomycetota bacterium]
MNLRKTRTSWILFFGFTILAWSLGTDNGFAQEATDAAGVVAGVPEFDWGPIALVGVGIVAVLGMIVGLRLNAFLALIVSAILVSLLVGIRDGGDAGDRMSAVVSAFGGSAGGVGIVIAMAAIIGKCMLDSGAADRIVRTAVGITGEKKISLGLTMSGFVLAVPVFFDTVFYLLVPLARSLFRRTNRNYLRYLMAIATGGCITHTLVPPTPGPLLVSSTLGVDIGMMMMVGVLVAIPSAGAGLLFSILIDTKMPIAMRPSGPSEEKHQPLMEDQLPSMGIALLPVLLPIVLIGAGTLATTIADGEDKARLEVKDVPSFELLSDRLASADASSPAGRFANSRRITAAEQEVLRTNPETESQKEAYIAILNDVLL